mgnify:CR=1 FL=1
MQDREDRVMHEPDCLINLPSLNGDSVECIGCFDSLVCNEVILRVDEKVKLLGCLWRRG